MTTTTTTDVDKPVGKPDLLGLFWSPLAHTVRFADLGATPAPATPPAAAAAAPTTMPIDGEQNSYLRPNGLEYLPRSLMVGEAKMHDVTLIRRSIDAGMPVLLYGDPGCGKTALVEAAFGSTGELFTVQGTVETETADFVGSWVQMPDGTYQWVDGPLPQAMEAGAKLLIDEIALVDPRVMAVVYGVMDGRDELVITQNPLRGAVKCAPGFAVIGACNPNVPGAQMSDALLSRFFLHMQMGTDWGLASRLGVGSKITQVVRNLNDKYSKGEMTSAPQLREMLQFRDVSAAFGEQFALRNFLSQIQPENRSLAVAAIESVFGQKITALIV